MAAGAGAAPGAGARRPVYFVSSNTHSLSNLVTGVALRHEDAIIAHTERIGDPDLGPELAKLRSGASRASWANFLYFAARGYFAANPNLRAAREAEEAAAGILYLPPEGAVDVAVQVIPLARLARTGSTPVWAAPTPRACAPRTP
ncbi:MAG: hypothetical protein U0531_04025 [Dehalococcoidia bacterium]